MTRFVSRSTSALGRGPPSRSAITSENGDVDTDGDELIDEQELEIGTDPTLYDTDGDALGDGAELREDGWGTDPLKADTDDDGYWDGDELFTFGTDPKDPESYPAEQVQSTMRISVRGLPLGYDGNDFANDSTALEGIAVAVLANGSDMATTVRTDQAGIATFNNLSEGTYQVILDIPGDSANFVTVFGTDDGFEPREHENQDTNHPIVYLGPGEQLNGTFYVMAFEDGGPPNLSSVQVSVRSLPVAYLGADHANDGTPLAGIEVTVAIPGSEFAVTGETDAFGMAAFGGLGGGDYQVILGIPGHDANFVTFFGAEGEIEPRPVDGQDTNAPTVHLNAGELLYGSFYVVPVESGAEPTKTPAHVGGEEVVGLPDTGAGSNEGSGFGTEGYIALTALVALATLGRVASRRRA